jgi:hypothetical protein
VRGNITSHRARSTIAWQLYNAREPMTLFELRQWLGHSSPHATQHYAKITPLKMAKSHADAGYFARNLRAIEVLVDQDVVRSGGAATEPWKFYDLGHGYCTYDFFEQCQHRMACAKCDFYMPKESTAALLLEGKTHLLQLLQENPLGDAEQAAVEDGVAAYENLLSKLADVATLAGPTPRQIGAGVGPDHICSAGTATFGDCGLVCQALAFMAPRNIAYPLVRETPSIDDAIGKIAGLPTSLHSETISRGRLSTMHTRGSRRPLIATGQ